MCSYRNLQTPISKTGYNVFDLSVRELNGSRAGGRAGKGATIMQPISDNHHKTSAKAFPFIHIRSAKFPVLPGEEDELVNEGTYGKALAQYLETQLKARSYDVACICCEDWGWWLELRGQPFVMGVCVYGSPDLPKTHELCVTISPEAGRCWSWRQFRFVDRTGPVTKLFAELREILVADPAIEVLGYPEGFPLRQ